MPFPALLGPMVPTAPLYAAVAMAAPVPLWMAPALAKRVSFPSPQAQVCQQLRVSGRPPLRVKGSVQVRFQPRGVTAGTRRTGESPEFGVAEGTEREGEPHGLPGQNGETEFPEPGQENYPVGMERALWRC